MPSFEGLAKAVIRSPLGGLIARPWLDCLILHSLKYWIFPVSRLWAGARAARGDIDQFIAEVPLKKATTAQRNKISKALGEFEKARLKASSTETLWELSFFGEEEVSAERLSVIEEMRLDTRSSYNLTRKYFRSLRRNVLSSVRMNPPTPADVGQRFGSNSERLKHLFKSPTVIPEITRSRSIATDYGCDYWIRFESPCSGLGDQVYARVYEPSDVENPPTLIFGHGICVEFDHYHQILDEITQITRHGIRVIRPEAPWHGRRVLPGHYGGEQFLSEIPISMFDFISAQHLEWACIINWCRTEFNTPVAIGGSSLGAQTAKAIAMSANDWPKAMQPDALFVVTHSRHIAEAALDGVLSDIWGLGESMRTMGWSKDLEEHWLTKIDPVRPPCVLGKNIVSVCGEKDLVTPMASAVEQMRDWGVPTENQFRYHRGHFSVPLGLIYDDSPIRRIATILKQLNNERL